LHIGTKITGTKFCDSQRKTKGVEIFKRSDDTQTRRQTDCIIYTIHSIGSKPSAKLKIY